MSFDNSVGNLAQHYLEGGLVAAFDIGIYGGADPPYGLTITAESDVPVHFSTFTPNTVSSNYMQSHRRITITTVDNGTEARIDTVITLTITDSDAYEATFQFNLQVFRTLYSHLRVYMTILTPIPSQRLMCDLNDCLPVQLPLSSIIPSTR